ncbi:MAG: nucleotidyltransferase family protein [Acidimicrobiia bacterium]
MSEVAIAVLAAGRGRRLGGRHAKPLLTLQGRPLVSWAIDAATATDFRPVVLVVGYQGRLVAREAREGVVVARARGWRRGAAHSLRAAIVALEPWAQVQAVCIGLADQPLVGPDAYRRLAGAHRDGAQLAVGTYDGTRINPVLLGRPLWHEARRLRGDVGARALMDRHDVTEVDCTGTGEPTDVDSLDDLVTLERRLEAEQ